MAKIVIYVEEKDLEPLFDALLAPGEDHHVKISLEQKERYVQLLLDIKEFDTLRLNYVDIETLPEIPESKL